VQLKQTAEKNKIDLLILVKQLEEKIDEKGKKLRNP
jgi:hypothetical protein